MDLTGPYRHFTLFFNSDILSPLASFLNTYRCSCANR